MSGERIQIVDDEHDFVSFLSKCLQRMDYVITDVATTGESAIAAARRSRPDLVLMDISLLGAMDGIEAATEIHRQLGIPVVYLTGSDDENTIQRAKISEPLGYLLKPFKPRELKSTIDTALYTFRASRERARESDRLAGEPHRSLFDDVVEGTFKAQRSGVVTSVNSAMARMLGFESCEQVLNSGMTLQSLLGIAPEAERELILRLNSHGAVDGYELEAKRRDGRKVVLHMSLRTGRDPARGADCVECTALDITGRIQMRDLVQQQERNYREIVESLPHLFWSCRPDGVCDYLNRQWTELTGIPADALRESAWFSPVHENDREPMSAAWCESLIRGRELEAECRMKVTEGSYRWFRMRAVPVRDADGKILKWLGSGTDIDDEKRASQELSGCRQILEALLTNVPQRVFWKDRELRFIGCNRHFAEDAGLLSPSEIVGKTDYDFYPQDVAEKHQREDRHVMETGKVFRVVEELQTRADEKLFLQVVKAPIEEAGHRIAGVIVICFVTSLSRP